MKDLNGYVYTFKTEEGVVKSKTYNYLDAGLADDFSDYREGLLASTGESGVSYSISPEILNLGFSSFIILQEGDRKICYACKRLNKLPNSVLSLGINYFTQSQRRESLVASREGYSLVKDSLSLLFFSITEKKDTIKISGHFNIDRRIHNYKDYYYPQNDFWNKNVSEKRHELFVDLLKAVIPQFNDMLIDRVSFFLYSSFNNNIENGIRENKYAYFLGVSPFYEIPYYVDSSSFESSNYQHKYPNKKRMTYDVSIIILPMSKI